jgi:uncharacterized HAD superfamily protein/hypoxanthine phosphoribosyltransferase
MYFKSVADLFHTVRRNAHKIPKDIELVVGIPRSGMLAATAVSLTLHKPMTDIHSFLEGKSHQSLSYREGVNQSETPNSVLIVDDSIHGGGAMKLAQDLIKQGNISAKITYAAIYGLHKRHDEVDFIFEICPAPRVFEWNVLNHWVLEYACVDLDGVLCQDPTPEQNDDGANYLAFLRDAEVLNAPKYRLNSIVTSRLEKYRPQTEDWLRSRGISYGRLEMLGGRTAEERRKLGLHAPFKAAIYKEARDCILFIESETRQAREINAITGKSTLAFREMIFFEETRGTRSARNIKQRAGRLLPDRIKHLVKSWV